MFYVLDSFCGQLWLAQDSPDIVPFGEIAEDTFPDILIIYLTHRKSMCVTFCGLSTH